ncbi:MAG: SUMF1/EgtB/PvdO family nonheme iron enzyme [Planctomycetota bacterium]
MATQRVSSRRRLRSLCSCGRGPKKPRHRVVRGGSWNNNGRNCRSANRNRNEPENRNNNCGFRVAARVR